MTRRSLLQIALSPHTCSIPTNDPGVVIVDWQPSCVTYHALDGRRWKVRGQCVACGVCEVGSSNPNLVWTGKPIGTPGACLDKTFGERRDNPITPDGILDSSPHCTLKGEWL